ncbi:unnamed protein product [Ranitomeya imitator]|uniref:Uncharacterized protein n=1 Tax=Ranitomeya imitator TaxID=111125 RepID=A0ABN9L7E5_9NEOB|nr:unnamed protein product [Ranitomeya imitator]
MKLLPNSLPVTTTIQRKQVLYLSVVEASWTYNTNLTDYNSAKQVEAAGIEQEFNYVWGKKAKELFLNTYGNFTDLELKKVIESIWTLGVANLVESERNQVDACRRAPTSGGIPPLMSPVREAEVRGEASRTRRHHEVTSHAEGAGVLDTSGRKLIQWRAQPFLYKIRQQRGVAGPALQTEMTEPAVDPELLMPAPKMSEDTQAAGVPRVLEE